jgi:hypothetical protein
MLHRFLYITNFKLDVILISATNVFLLRKGARSDLLSSFNLPMVWGLTYHYFSETREINLFLVIGVIILIIDK